MKNAIIQALGKKIVGNLQLFGPDRDKGIMVRDLVTQKEAPGEELGQVIGLGEAQEMIQTKLKTADSLTGKNRAALFALLQKLLRPNLTFNKNETESRKRKAYDEVKPVLFQMKKGEMIA